jgi:acetylornithine deacetylase/succinyl-diaminopimelate desuccinylase-like protein
MDRDKLFSTNNGKGDDILASLNDLHRIIDVEFTTHLDAIREFVRTPSISADGTGIAETAEMVRGLIKGVGGEAQIVPTEGHPIVYGELSAGQPKTLLIYGMYDVQPVEGEDWLVPPFSAEIVNIPNLGDCIVARGIHNSKGPLRAFFNALSVMTRMGELPVNLKFVIEGEEEQSSPHLPGFLVDHKAQLAADAVFSPFFSLDSKGKAILYLGQKGVMKFQLVCTGGEWGGPNTRGIHSRNAAWIASPVWRLIHALSTMVAPDESITIDGFYECLKGPTAEDEELLERLDATFDEQTALRENDAIHFKHALHRSELVRDYLFSPTLNVNGLIAGHVGEGIKTVLPYEAIAKIDVRLLPDMTVEDTLAKIRSHVDRHGFDDIRIEGVSGYGPSRSSVKESVVQAMIETCRYHGCEPEIWPYLPGSARFCLFTQDLGLPLIMGGLGHGGRAHSPNEYAVVDQLRLFEQSMITFLNLYAQPSLTSSST